MFKRVVKLKFFGTAISNYDKVQKYIKIRLEAVQLTDGAGQKFPILIVADAYAKVK